MNPFIHIDFSISDSLKTVQKSVLIYETIIVLSMTFFYLTGVFIVCGLKIWLIMNAGVNSYSKFAIFPLVIFLAFTIAFYRDALSKKVLVILLFYAVSAVGEIITSRLFTYIYKISMADYFRHDIFWNVIIFDHVLIALLLLIVEIIWKKQKIENGSSRDGCFLLMLIGQIFFFLPNVIKSVDMNAQLSMVSLFGVLAGCIFCFVLPVIISETEMVEKAERDIEELNKNYEFEEIHYKLLEEKQEQLTKIRHDFNNQLMAIAALYGLGRLDEATAMIMELEIQLEEKGSIDSEHSVSHI